MNGITIVSSSAPAFSSEPVLTYPLSTALLAAPTNFA